VSIQAALIAWPAEHAEALLAFFFELREKGMGATIPMVAVKAARIFESFND
jgi:hypothetical protein